MALDREAIYTALLAKLQTVPQFVSVTRIWKHWDDTRPHEQPLAIITHGDESIQPQHGQPPIWRLQPTIMVYLRRDTNKATIPGTEINEILTAIEAALEDAPDDGPFGGPNESATTLGGLCASCAISGQVVVDEGIIGGQAVIVAPLEILVG